MYLMWFIVYMAQLHPIISEWAIRAPAPLRCLCLSHSVLTVLTDLIPLLSYATEPKRSDVRFLEH